MATASTAAPHLPISHIQVASNLIPCDLEEVECKAKTASKEVSCVSSSVGVSSPQSAVKSSRPTPDEAVAELVEVLKKASETDYIGEPISQLEHALQCAKFARDAGGDDETVMGALLHDVGHLVALSETCQRRLEINEPIGRMGQMGATRHEVLGARYLKALGFSDKVANIVQGHVQAKRYLVWKDERYLQKLSPASKVTLEYQGGPMTDSEAREFEKDVLFNVILKLRTWDDKAKVIGAKVPSMEHWTPMLLRHLQQA